MAEDPFIDVIRATVDVLDREGVPYAITGSIASGIHGEPIQSQDVDIAIRMTEAQAVRIARLLPKRFYRSEEGLAQAAREFTFANLIDTETGLKVDLSVLPPSPFFDLVLTRSRPTLFAQDAPRFRTVTPEDIILMKLDWRKDSKSQKQWDNALSVVRVQRNRLDWKYLYEQAETLGVQDDLIRMRDEAGV